MHTDFGTNSKLRVFSLVLCALIVVGLTIHCYSTDDPFFSRFFGSRNDDKHFSRLSTLSSKLNFTLFQGFYVS